MTNKPEWLKGESAAEQSQSLVTHWQQAYTDTVFDWLRNNRGPLLWLEALIEAVLEATRSAILESAIRIANGFDVPCDPRTEAEETAHRIANDIAALANKPAGAEQGNGDLIAKAVADEREACARIAEAPFTGQPHTERSRGKMEAANTIARNIRARDAVAQALGEEKKR